MALNLIEIWSANTTSLSIVVLIQFLQHHQNRLTRLRHGAIRVLERFLTSSWVKNYGDRTVKGRSFAVVFLSSV